MGYAEGPGYRPFMVDDSFEARAARRRETWSGELRGTQRAAQADESTPAQRILSMRELAEAGWALMGRPLPDYDRAHLPGRVLREGSQR